MEKIEMLSELYDTVLNKLPKMQNLYQFNRELGAMEMLLIQLGYLEFHGNLPRKVSMKKFLWMKYKSTESYIDMIMRIAKQCISDHKK